MADRIPGSQCAHNSPEDIEDGTLCRAQSSTPAPVGILHDQDFWRGQETAAGHRLVKRTKLRRVKMLVGGDPVGQVVTWAYPNGEGLGYFLIPNYRLTVSGTDAVGKAVSETFEVLRFGVQSKDGKSARVVGLADEQTHTIKAWLPDYQVHSAESAQNGAWQVYGNFLIHAGPETKDDAFASIGCIEIMGRGGFVKFNDLLIKLSGPSAALRTQQLTEIGNAGNMEITYHRTSRPPLKKAKEE